MSDDNSLKLLELFNHHLDNTDRQILLLSTLYREGSLKESQAALVELVDNIELFVQVVNNLQQHQKIKGNRKINENVDELIKELVNILRSILEAREKNDTVMISDLLEYELARNLTAWKEEAIPQYRKIIIGS